MEFKELIEECLLYVKTNFPGEKIKLSGELNDITLSFQDCEFYGSLEEVYQDFYNFLVEDNEEREHLNREFRKGWDSYKPTPFSATAIIR